MTEKPPLSEEQIKINQLEEEQKEREMYDHTGALKPEYFPKQPDPYSKTSLDLAVERAHEEASAIEAGNKALARLRELSNEVIKKNKKNR